MFKSPKPFLVVLFVLAALVAVAQTTVVKQLTDIYIVNDATNAVALKVIKPIANVAPFVTFGSQTNTVYSVGSTGLVTAVAFSGDGSQLTDIAVGSIGSGTSDTGTNFLRDDGIWTNKLGGDFHVEGGFTVEGTTTFNGDVNGSGYSFTANLVSATEGNFEVLYSTVRAVPIITANSGQELGAQLVYIDGSTGSTTYSLPDPTDPTVSAGYSQSITLKRIDMTASVITLNVTGGALIDGLSSIELLPYRAYEFANDGTNWLSIADVVGRGSANQLLSMDSSGEIPVFKTILATNGVAVTHTDTVIEFKEWVAAPATASSTGTPGQKAYADGFFYVCIATDTWQRVAIATW